MYNPAHFAEDRIDVLHAFIRQHPLATLVTAGHAGPEASHVPVVLHPDTGANGIVRCHLARANKQWESVQSGPVLLVFQGPAHYISPSWYPSKNEHGKVVPTWNYVAVHVRGRGKVLDKHSDLLDHLQALTKQQEQVFATPWSVADAPAEYIKALSSAIVGIEISIDAIEGKWKLSQNRAASDRQGVVAGLTAINSPRSLEMAQLVKERV